MLVVGLWVPRPQGIFFLFLYIRISTYVDFIFLFLPDIGIGLYSPSCIVPFIYIYVLKYCFLSPFYFLYYGLFLFIACLSVSLCSAVFLSSPYFYLYPVPSRSVPQMTLPYLSLHRLLIHRLNLSRGQSLQGQHVLHLALKRPSRTFYSFTRLLISSDHLSPPIPWNSSMQVIGDHMSSAADQNSALNFQYLRFSGKFEPKAQTKDSDTK